MTGKITLQPNSSYFEMVQNNFNELQRMQTVILNSFQDENLSQEELQLKRKIVLETLPMGWPLIPLSKGIFSGDTLKYIQNIHSKFCLDSKSNLWQLWVNDIQVHLKAVYQYLVGDKCMGISTKEIEDIGSEFAVTSLMLLIFSVQNKLEVATVQKLVSSLEKFNYNYPRLMTVYKKIESFKLKASNISETAKKQSLTIPGANYKKQFEDLHKNADLIEKHLKYIEWSLNLGLAFWHHTYYRQYFHGIELGSFVAEPKSESIGLSQENISKINQFINVVRNGWKEADQKRYLAAIPGIMVSLNHLPQIENFSSKKSEDIRFYTLALKKGLCELETKYESIASLYFQSLSKDFSWPEVKQELHKIEPNSPLEIDQECINIRKPNEWLSEMISCFSVANSQLMIIHRMYENVICKNTIPNFISFDELCNRLTINFQNIFTENLKETSIIDQPSEDLLDQVIDNFAKDLSEINKQFGAKINEHLPDREMINFCIFKFSLLKNSLVSAKTLLPFSPAVIFVATRVLPAIKKAHTWLFKRFDRALKNIDGKKLESEREFILERLEGLCFIKMKPLLELLITIRDIQAVLLDPQECSQELEKGLHLIPSEFAHLLQPSEITELIDLYIQKGMTNDESVEDPEDMISILQDLSTEDKSIQQIPPLQNNLNQKNVIKILNTLSDSRSFKIGKGEKTIKILKRLRELGAYKLRSGKGSHTIWAHPNTQETFPYPSGDDLSLGVAKQLEDWVNIAIFKNKKL